jgi:hypothetical protein
MTSSFSELYSDFLDQIKVYTQQLDVTPVQFMRYLTRGMQKFQRETEYIERLVTIPIDAVDNVFYIPNDFLHVLALKDCNGYLLLQGDIKQYDRNVELWDGGYLETPTDYAIRIVRDTTDLSDIGRSSSQQKTRLYSIYRRVIEIHPDEGDTELYMRYIPDIHAFSQNSTQWSSWFPINDNFNTLFNASAVSASFAPYEDAFISYAISQFLKSKGSVNYRIFEKDFLDEIERAKINKPTQTHEAVRDYFMAPYS